MLTSVRTRMPVPMSGQAGGTACPVHEGNAAHPLCSIAVRLARRRRVLSLLVAKRGARALALGFAAT